MKRISLLTLLILSTGYGIISAQRIRNSADLFVNGEKLCFIGNSITHSGSYHSLIYLFYQTRYPDRRLDVYNCGISGDNAGGALIRFNKDIAIHHPTIATIKLGTNDINRGLYNAAIGPKTEEKMKANLYYRNNMNELVRKLDSAGAKIIFLTPAYFEEKPLSDSTSLTGLNDGFLKYGMFLDSLRAKYNSGIVDFHFILDSISKARQKVNPGFTLNRIDRVHPEYDGHFIMAYAFLKALPVSPFISYTEIDAKRKKILSAINCEVEGIKTIKKEIVFTSTEKSLPFPLSAYPKDTTLIPFTRKFNQEILKITGIDLNQKYLIRIDTCNIGIFSGQQLNDGINLALIPLTPQARQAEIVAGLNEKRRQFAAQIRDLKMVEYNILKPEEKYLGKERKKEILDERLKVYEGKSTYSYFKGQFANYIENFDKEKEKNSSVQKLVDEIYKINQTVTHNFSLKPL
jgi:hypothetical protein